MNTPTPGAAAELPVVAFDTSEGLHYPDAMPFRLLPPMSESAVALTPHAPAQSQLDALREEVANWQAVVWSVDRVLNCLPSTFSDGNSHVLKAAIKLHNELAALKAQPTDVDALMALADEYAEARSADDWQEVQGFDQEAIDAAAGRVISTREALRAKLAARKEPK